MQLYAAICSYMQLYAAICSYMQLYDEVLTSYFTSIFVKENILGESKRIREVLDYEKEALLDKQKHIDRQNELKLDEVKTKVDELVHVETDLKERKASISKHEDEHRKKVMDDQNDIERQKVMKQPKQNL
jgi:hypothetical protein